METKSLSFEQMENLNGGSDGTFWCNLASGGIGAVYGAWGAGIASAVFGASAIASGGVSIVIGLTVGAIISTVACSSKSSTNTLFYPAIPIG